MSKFILPIYGIVKPTKNNKNCAITLNWSRAAHYRDYGKAKKMFKLLINNQLRKSGKFDGQIKISYVYYANKNGTDLDNFVGVARKFFQDALSEFGLIEDDNTNIIIESSECYGGIDKLNPRVEAEIIKLNNGV